MHFHLRPAIACRKMGRDRQREALHQLINGIIEMVSNEWQSLQESMLQRTFLFCYLTCRQLATLWNVPLLGLERGHCEVMLKWFKERGKVAGVKASDYLLRVGIVNFEWNRERTTCATSY